MSNKEISISVIMSVYNGAKFLTEAINSILNQTFYDFEFLIVNDGSTDESRKIITSYNDHRIKLINNKVNIGLTKSLNKAIKFAKGKYIARMDADDISTSGRFEKQFSFMEDNLDVDICGTNYKIIDTEEVSKLPLKNEDIKVSLFFGKNPLAHPSIIFRTHFLVENNIYYDEGIKYAQDFHLWVKVFPFGKFSNLQEQLLLYRRHSQQITALKDEEQRLVLNQGLISLLKIFDVYLAENEKIQYFSFIFGKTPKTITEINSVIKQCKELLKKNKDKKILPHGQLKKELGLKLKYFIKNHFNDSHKNILQNKSFIKYLGIKETIKLLLNAK